MSRKYFCDRCGKELESYLSRNSLLMESKYRGYSFEFVFCQECWNKEQERLYSYRQIELDKINKTLTDR